MSHRPGFTSAPSNPKAAMPNQFGGIGMPSGRALKAAARYEGLSFMCPPGVEASARKAGGTKFRSVASRTAMRIWNSSTSAGTGFW